MTTTERKPHPHAEVIKKWADGYEVQFWHGPTETWEDVTVRNPLWYEDTKYRVKPEPKKPTTWYQILWRTGDTGCVYLSSRLISSLEEWEAHWGKYGHELIKLIPIYTEENVE